MVEWRWLAMQDAGASMHCELFEGAEEVRQRGIVSHSDGLGFPWIMPPVVPQYAHLGHPASAFTSELEVRASELAGVRCVTKDDVHEEPVERLDVVVDAVYGAGCWEPHQFDRDEVLRPLVMQTK